MSAEGKPGGKFCDDIDELGNPKVPFRGRYERKYCDWRRAWVEKFADCSLEQCGQWWLNEGSSDSCSCAGLRGNIENPIGLAKVPLAVCGPLLIKGQHVDGLTLCPLASTEGALVASITRGATALTRAGGVRVRVLEQVQIRSPCFIFHSIDEVDLFARWLDSNFSTAQQRVSYYLN